MFLEYGQWLLVNAPIRHVALGQPQDGDPFPMEQLAASPLLRCLDSLDLDNCAISDSQLAQLLASPNLERLRLLDLSTNRSLTGGIYEMIASAPSMRKLVALVRKDYPMGTDYPGQRFEQFGNDGNEMPIMKWTDLAPAGKALEQKYGYLPWLHPPDNHRHAFDLAWYVEHGVLPVKPIGSPVDP